MELVIRLVNGQMVIGGNVKDKLQAIGLLEMAKQAILGPPSASGGVQVPPPDVQQKLLAGCE